MLRSVGLFLNMYFQFPKPWLLVTSPTSKSVPLQCFQTEKTSLISSCRKIGENILQQLLLLLLIIFIITLIIIITITIFTTIVKCLTFVRILLTIPLDGNMIPCLFQLNLCPLSSSIYFYQNWFTTTKQVFDVLFKEAVNAGFLFKKMFLKVLLNSQENTFVGVSLLIKLQTSSFQLY